MRSILVFSSLLLILIISLIVLTNISNTITLETFFISLRVNVGFLILFCAIAASLTTLLLSASFSKPKDRSRKEIEEKKLSHEIESEKVKHLEAKIKTLEEALKAATKK